MLWGCLETDPSLRVLVFSKTEGFRHASIEEGTQAIRELGEKYNFQVDATEDASVFTQSELQQYHVIIFLCTTGDVLDEAQQLEFQRWVQGGGGFVGVHSATDTEYEWPWYNELVGGYFAGHPPGTHEAAIEVVDGEHISTKHLPEKWMRTDEWYNFKQLISSTNKLLMLDEDSYEGGNMGDNHPIAWYREFDGGRSWYTGLGHTSETYAEPLFLEHLWGGIQYAAGGGSGVDYSKPTVAPAENRFEKVVLAENLNEPMELDFLPGEKIIFVERKGAIKEYNLKRRELRTVHQMRVHTDHEDGLLGVAVDPSFYSNRWVYFFYSDPDSSRQLVSRFTYEPKGLYALTDEHILLSIPVQREECCHSGGSLQFGRDRTLYISVGDNTNPFKSNGYAPIDGRPGRKPFDARRSSSNTNDLRGKVLRIQITEAGESQIPEGNLFPKDGSKGRPEIYAMGCRNPYRIAVDSVKNVLYWGDVGPDAAEAKEGRGPAGHDEINRAPAPGYFGWPLFVGNNKPYHGYDFDARVSGQPFEPERPLNQSPFNTGLEVLPPAQPAFIWYPYGKSEEFPQAGSGGRTAMAGPTYYYDKVYDNPNRYPEYFDEKLFIYEWMRGWMMVVTMDEEGNFQRMERFMPSHSFSNPTDLEFTPRGELFLLEYGKAWFAQNNDARLVQLKYHPGNRPPMPEIKLSDQYGTAPLAVSLSASPSIDYDADPLTYKWYADGTLISTDSSARFTFEENGMHIIRLIATDPSGAIGTTEKEIWVGNSRPELEIALDGNTTFYWDKQKINYEIQVKDKEDGSLQAGISPEEVTLNIDYLEEGYDITEIAMGHQQQAIASPGEKLIQGSDCLACHQIEKASIGPSYQEIAERYDKESPELVQALAGKIINGGGGVWGERMMSAHPALSDADAQKMVKFILSLNNEKETARFPIKGQYVFQEHLETNSQGRYVFSASYTDRGGGGVKPITARDQLMLRHYRLRAVERDFSSNAEQVRIRKGDFPDIKNSFDAIELNNANYIGFENIGLSGIESLQVILAIPPETNVAGKIEVRIKDRHGPLIGEADICSAFVADGLQHLSIPLEKTEGQHKLYFIYSDGEEPVNLGFIEFLNAEQLRGLEAMLE